METVRGVKRILNKYLNKDICKPHKFKNKNDFTNAMIAQKVAYLDWRTALTALALYHSTFGMPIFEC